MTHTVQEKLWVVHKQFILFQICALFDSGESCPPPTKDRTDLEIFHLTFFAVGTLTPCPSSSLAAESMAQGEHKLAPYSKTARNTVNKELVNQPLREAEGYEYTDKYKTSYWDFYLFFFLQVWLKPTLTLGSCCSLLHIPQQKRTIPKMLHVYHVF